MRCVVTLGKGVMGGSVWFEAPIMHVIFGLALACYLCACAIKEPFRDCLFGWCVILMTRVG